MSQAILYLDFLHEIALDGATLDISSGEQAALDSQYRDFRTRLKALWVPSLRFRPETRRWLLRVANSGFANIYTSTLSGVDLVDARNNSAEACRVVSGAIAEIASCF